MKPGSITGGRILIACCIISITLVLVSWDHKQVPGRNDQLRQTQDTVPQKKDRKIRDLDEALAELEAVDINIELNKAMAEVNKALKELDLQKIQLDVERSMKEVDLDKIKAEVHDAMKEVDLAKIEQEVKQSLAKIDWNKMKANWMRLKKLIFQKWKPALRKPKRK